jgi:hypothetical protein
MCLGQCLVLLQEDWPTQQQLLAWRQPSAAWSSVQRSTLRQQQCCRQIQMPVQHCMQIQGQIMWLLHASQ